jgi:hypothetical protein
MVYVFIDFEASSLSDRGHPIEIAWVLESGQGESYLILPEPAWSDWSPRSERVHGISQDVLVAEGRCAAWVARRAAAVLGRDGVTAVSDAPEHDASWLAALLAAADLLPIAVRDVREAYGSACLPLSADGLAGVAAVAARLIADATAAEAMRPRTVHRALPDAESLWRAYADIRRRVAAHIVGATGG